ncbi:hypothetical protein [Paraburkholderia sediminicola]|uniref:hypothetical protein n=1 Tax=Paraburkholderia sediminicola TaxID=458836 RepID=UPI0038B760CE
MIAMRFHPTLRHWALAALLAIPTGASSMPSAFPDGATPPMKPLASSNVKNCGLTLSYPALKNSYDEDIALNCIGSYKEAHGTSLGIDYSRYPNDPERTSRFISMEINPVGIDDWLAADKEHDAAFEQTSNGVRLLPKYSFGNECHNLLRTLIKPISGSNWHGWIAEEVYGKASNRGNNDYCRIYAPKNRCVHLLVGNKKMSVELTGACLLRKKTTNLDEGFSYDFFMQMIKSIRFNEE